jgi:adenine-specific DNA methylase
MMSAWNSKKTAMGAFEKLIQRLPVKKVIVSYNNESLVDSDSLLKMFRKFPSVIVHEIDYKRNIMCQIGNAAKDNTTFKTENKEFLFVIEKA